MSSQELYLNIPWKFVPMILLNPVWASDGRIIS